MKKLHILVGLALAAGSIGAAQAIAVDFSGYARGGYGVNTNGGRQTCFSLKGTRNVETHYRLGNECDYTLELNLNSTLAKNTDGSEWHVNFMLKNWRDWKQASSNKLDTTGYPATTPSFTSAASYDNQGPATSFAQAYAYGQNMPILSGGTIWAGRRYYNRVQLGINDHFLENDDGDGFGVDNVNLGAGIKLNAGITVGNDELNGQNGQANNFHQKYIFSVTDIPTFAGSKLRVHAKLHRQSKSDIVTLNSDGSTSTAEVGDDKTNGYSVLFFHETPNVLNGTLSAGVRFSKRTHNEGDGKSSLLFVQQAGNFGHHGYDLVSEFKSTKYTGTSIKDRWFSLGGRLDAQIYGPLRGIAELGYDTVKRSGASSGNNTYNFTHVTLAAAFSAGADAGARPVVRLYYTYGKWNDNVRKDAAWGWPNNGNTSDAAKVWGNKTSGSALGAQWEAWW